MSSSDSNPSREGDSAMGSKRGRRPLEAEDGGSVTNRRRMQNRMAQRAYRQRKESAIDILKRKIQELEKSKEEMGREFVNFTSVILEQDAIKQCPDIIKHIKHSTITLISSAGEPDDIDEARGQDTQGITPVIDLQTTVLDDVSPPLEQTEGFDLPILDPATQVHGGDLFNTTVDSQPCSNSNFDSTPYSFNAHSYFQAPSNQQFYSMYQLPGSTIDSSLPCPRSYAAQEHTFGRRLHRASQEAGFLLASMKHSPPTWYRKVFGFCLHFETRDEITARLRESVRKCQDTTLNNWKYPFTNIGGSGLFYPQEHGYGTGGLPVGNLSLPNEVYRPSEMSGFSMGPFGPSVEEVRDLRLNPQLRIIDREYDGDFFDSDEIEICLRGYGVTIPPSKDFVTAHIDMAMFEPSSGSNQPVDRPISSDDIEYIIGEEPQVEDVAFHCPAGMVGMAMGAMPPPPKPTSEEHWKTPFKRDTKVKVDVERLITYLVTSTVCLGRTPAVRPLDIRKALKLAIVQDE
ncbi:Ff.00g135330.m01.CDS01 [Fusarium sp. VM40]|nr:Ff.00g135330.m01.CDS01 [Fusarium sp. VM40]